MQHSCIYIFVFYFYEVIQIVILIMQLQLENKSDLFGALASGLCLIHCMATPLLFIGKACSAVCCASAPLWWQLVDYVFIVISFIAIFYAAKNSSKSWMKFAMYGTWLSLLLVVLMESFSPGLLPSYSVYIPALSIVGLHLYNYKYCQCGSDNCIAA